MWEVFATVLVSVSFLYLFVCVDDHAGGPLVAMKVFFFRTLPDCLRAVGRKTCGERFVNLIETFAHYLCFESNPLVQLLYLALAFGGFYLYV